MKHALMGKWETAMVVGSGEFAREFRHCRFYFQSRYLYVDAWGRKLWHMEALSVSMRRAPEPVEIRTSSTATLHTFNARKALQRRLTLWLLRDPP